MTESVADTAPDGGTLPGHDSHPDPDRGRRQRACVAHRRTHPDRPAGRGSHPAAAGRGPVHQGVHQRPGEGPRQAVDGGARLHRGPPGPAGVPVPVGGHPLEPGGGGPAARVGSLGRGRRRLPGPAGAGRPSGPARADALLGLVESLCRLDRGREAIALGGRGGGAAGRARSRCRMRCSLATGWRMPISSPAMRSRRAHSCCRSWNGRAQASARVIRRPPDAAADGAWRRSPRTWRTMPAAVAYLEEARASRRRPRRPPPRVDAVAAGHEPRRHRGHGGCHPCGSREPGPVPRDTGPELEAASSRTTSPWPTCGWATSSRALAVRRRGTRRCTRRTTTDARWRTCSRPRPRSPSRPGDTDGALRLAREAMAHATASDDQRALSSSLLTIARAHATAGDTDAALEAYARAAEALRRTGPVAATPAGPHRLGRRAGTAGSSPGGLRPDPRGPPGVEPDHSTCRHPARPGRPHRAPPRAVRRSAGPHGGQVFM